MARLIVDSNSIYLRKVNGLSLNYAVDAKAVLWEEKWEMKWPSDRTDRSYLMSITGAPESGHPQARCTAVLSPRPQPISQIGVAPPLP